MVHGLKLSYNGRRNKKESNHARVGVESLKLSDNGRRHKKKLTMLRAGVGQMSSSGDFGGLDAKY